MRRAVDLKSRVQTLRDRSASGPVNREDVVELMRTLASTLVGWAETKALAGIGPYAQDQLGDSSLDVGAEFTAMETEATSLRDWIFTNFPKDASGAWLVREYGSDGSITQLTFTSAQMGGFRTRADSLIATIG